MAKCAEFDVTPCIVKEQHRPNFLPKHVKAMEFIKFENLVYDFAQGASEDYKGAYWEFVELPIVVMGSKLFFMYPRTSKPEKVFNCQCAENYYDGKMSDLAFGAACTLYALNTLAWAWNGKNNEHSQYYSNQFHALKCWALDHIPDGIEVHRILD